MTVHITKCSLVEKSLVIFNGGASSTLGTGKPFFGFLFKELALMWFAPSAPCHKLQLSKQSQLAW